MRTLNPSVDLFDNRDDHCLQQLEVQPEYQLVFDFYDVPYPEMNPTYDLIVMFMSLPITERCLNTIKVIQGKGKNLNVNLPL
jgi:hypothetical protein